MNVYYSAECIVCAACACQKRSLYRNYPFITSVSFVCVSGVAPPSFVAIHAGTTLHQLTSSGDALSWTSIAVLSGLAILSLLPVLFKKRLREKFEWWGLILVLLLLKSRSCAFIYIYVCLFCIWMHQTGRLFQRFLSWAFKCFLQGNVNRQRKNTLIGIYCQLAAVPELLFLYDLVCYTENM